MLRTFGSGAIPALLIVSGLPLALSAQDRPDPDSLLGDLHTFTAFIREEHVHPFTPSTLRAFDSLEAHIAGGIATTTTERLRTDIMRLAALVNDEHTMVWPERNTWLPYRLRWFDEGIVITATDSAHVDHALHRVLSINDHGIGVIAGRFNELVKQDNASYVIQFLNWHFDDPAILIGLGIIDDRTAIPFELLSPTGDTLCTTVKVTSGPTSVLVRAPVFNTLLAWSGEANYWSRFDVEDRSLYFQYRRCEEDPDLAFDAFHRELFRLIDSLRPDRLIVDLRSNSGGASAVLAPFLRDIRKSYLNREGRIRVLIGPGVFSSALMNAVELKRNTSALFIGQMTGANINHYGELHSIELPYTHVRVTCSTKWWENWKGMDGGLRPDVEVPNTWADLVKGHDRALEEALTAPMPRMRR